MKNTPPLSSSHEMIDAFTRSVLAMTARAVELNQRLEQNKDYDTLALFGNGFSTSTRP